MGRCGARSVAREAGGWTSWWSRCCATDRWDEWPDGPMGGGVVDRDRGHVSVVLGSQWVDARGQDLVAAGQLVRRDAFGE